MEKETTRPSRETTVSRNGKVGLMGPFEQQIQDIRGDMGCRDSVRPCPVI